jgi:hypothetical protein
VIEITDSSTPTFAGDVSVSNNKYGIGVSAGSGATFGGIVNIQVTTAGPNLGDSGPDPIGVFWDKNN